MKKVNIKRFQQKNPEDISFQGSSIPEKAPKTAISAPPPAEDIKNERTNETTLERTNERTVKKDSSFVAKPENNNAIISETSYTVVIPADRVKTRHSYDVFEDQKEALEKIQMALKYSGQKKKPVLGEMVQEAIDLYIQQQAKKLNNLKIIKERSSERTNERSSE